MADLFDKETAVVAEIVTPMEETQETGLTVPAQEPSYSGGSQALIDLRQGAMTMPIEQMGIALEEYRARRSFFFNWLIKQLTKGVHYGFPPGCEVRFDQSGNAITKKWNSKNRGYDEIVIPLDQWKHKPCLYKAGADFIADLMGLRPEFESDHETHKQLVASGSCTDRDGKPQPVLCYICRLFSRANPQLVVGEGRGARMLGTKGGDVNNTIKMAQKAAKVDAVINTYGLSDLFTQDVEDAPREPYETPTTRPESPPVQPRAKRVTAADVKALVDRYKARKPNATPDDFAKFCFAATAKTFKNVLSPGEWCQGDLNHVDDKIAMELES